MPRVGSARPGQGVIYLGNIGRVFRDFGGIKGGRDMRLSWILILEFGFIFGYFLVLKGANSQTTSHKREATKSGYIYLNCWFYY